VDNDRCSSCPRSDGLGDVGMKLHRVRVVVKGDNTALVLELSDPASPREDFFRVVTIAPAPEPKEVASFVDQLSRLLETRPSS
jgi:hypothetical protein